MADDKESVKWRGRITGVEKWLKRQEQAEAMIEKDLKKAIAHVEKTMLRMERAQVEIERLKTETRRLIADMKAA
ncbi:MAG: hypothetical protein WCB68_12920 [Pyrinomonadaceae bacterium]